MSASARWNHASRQVPIAVSLGGAIFQALQLLRARLRRPGYWAAYGLFLIGFVLVNVISEIRHGSLSDIRVWPTLLVMPVLYASGMVWFSPVPWQVKPRTRLLQYPWLLALLFSEFYLVGNLVVDSMVHAAAGKDLSIIAFLPSQMIYHGPAMCLVGRVLSSREQLTELNQELQQQAREAQTRVLQGQLHPHVLFNALNGLAELIHKNPQEAERSVRHLSDLLRKVLRAIDNPHYSLGDERRMLEHYLDMEGLRMGKRLRLVWEWDSSLEDIYVPPFLVQPLVENAIKHGVAPCRGGGELHIQARRENHGISLLVANTGLPLGEGTAEGASIGLKNLRARLELVFGGKASFSLRSEGQWTLAEIHLPWVPC